MKSGLDGPGRDPEAGRDLGNRELLPVMADEDRFKIGRCYFLVGYYDARLTMPKIKTLIFLGKKHLEDGSDECWCFGTPQSMEPPGKVEVDQPGARLMLT